MSQVTISTRPKKTPPSAASPPLSIHTNSTTRCTSMPDASARSRLAETARTAVPIRVFCRSAAMPRSTTTASTVTVRSRGVMPAGPRPIALWMSYWA
ncbi:hypothetical protein KEF29_13820 [Streptomyces tuirus]|uniref:Uncharacterized protein n=1 Tax=Streptomyces tuirus TaxID=68278 RepID=A0A941FAU5_9ACTN|nr:hypothetical protein [Streptomyces tuirus]